MLARNTNLTQPHFTGKSHSVGIRSKTSSVASDGSQCTYRAKPLREKWQASPAVSTIAASLQTDSPSRATIDAAFVQARDHSNGITKGISEGDAAINVFVDMAHLLTDSARQRALWDSSNEGRALLRHLQDTIAEVAKKRALSRFG